MPPTRSMRSALMSAAVGTLVGIVLVTASFAVYGPPARPAGRVTLDGVEVAFAYNASASHIFGRDHQQSCGGCPLILPGGVTYPIRLFSFAVPSNFSVRLIFNVTAVVPFQVVTYGCPGSLCELTKNFSSVGGFDTISADETRGFLLNLPIADPAPTIPGGYWIYFNVTALVSYR